MGAPLWQGVSQTSTRLYWKWGTTCNEVLDSFTIGIGLNQFMDLASPEGEVGGDVEDHIGDQHPGDHPLQPRLVAGEPGEAGEAKGDNKVKLRKVDQLG